MLSKNTKAYDVTPKVSMGSSTTTPRIIHQMWLDVKANDNTVPPKKFLDWGFPQSWKELNPEFDYQFWNRTKILTLFNVPELAKYKSFWLGELSSQIILQADFARFMIQYYIGGVYIDMGISPFKT
jgi:mannosyltransferase OCH1-like enzyme